MVALQKSRSNEGTKTRDMGILAVGVALGVTAAVISGVGSIYAHVNCAADVMAIQATTSTSHQAAFFPPGMNPIYSYYGKFNHLADEIPTTWWLETSEKHKDRFGAWFSQHGQDVAVAKFFNFKRDGFFVDLAANDAVWASNTFSLEQNFGWKGICIEANPQYWYRLSFRNCHVVGGIVGGTNNVEVDVILGQAHHGPYGGIVGDDFDNKKITKK